MPLTLEQKSDVRRHLEFPLAGQARSSPAGGTLFTGPQQGYRFFQAYGQLEYRLNALAPDEEARLMGKALAGFALVNGTNPTPGSAATIQVTIPITGAVNVTYTAIAGETQFTFIANLASAINNTVSLANAGLTALAPYGTGAFSGSSQFTGGNPAGNFAVPIPQLSIVSNITFSPVSVVSTTGNVSLALTSSPAAAGQFIAPSAITDKTTLPFTVTYGYIPIANALEASMVQSFYNADTSQAAVWSARPDEFDEKRKIYRRWCRMIWDYLGLGGEGGGIGSGHMSVGV